MAFPIVESITPSSFPSNAQDHFVAMPATVNAGDLLLCLMANDGSATQLPEPPGWTLMRHQHNSDVRFAYHFKVADGTEGGTTANFRTSANEKAAAQVYRISAWEGTLAGVLESQFVATGPSANPDPNFNTPPWGAADTLWIAAYGADDDDDATAYPLNYTNGTYTESDTGAGSASMGSAWRQLNAASEDASAFTIAASEEWVAFTVAIRPASAVVTGSASVLSLNSVVASGFRGLFGSGAILSLNSVATLGRKILYGKITNPSPSELRASGSKVSFGTGSILAKGLMEITDTVVGAKAFVVSIAASIIGPSRSLYPRRLYSSRKKLESHTKRKKRIRYGMELKPGERVGSHHKRAAVRGVYGPEVKKLVLLERLGPRRAKKTK